MEEIEVGEYVRSNLGTMGKVTKIDSNTNTRFLYEDKTLITIDKNVYKHSKNIIDLIEVGDYVNGKEVHKYNGNIGIVSINELGWTFIAFKDKKYPIETIVTHEQFASMEYKVED